MPVSPLLHVYKLLATVLGIGYLKGGGTLAAAVSCLVLYLARTQPVVRQPWPAILCAIGLLAIGSLVAQQLESVWGKDSYRIVVDEVAGMWVSVLLVPITGPRLVAGFVLFRFFDIYKPLLIKRLERVPGGLGVMLDDALAGLYTNLLLHLGVGLGYL